MAATALASFLSYSVTGYEHEAETEAIKLILSDEAARFHSLAFKLYIGLMAHPYDALDFAIDHIEYEIAKGAPLAPHLRVFLDAVAEKFPDRRAGSLSKLLGGSLNFIPTSNSDTLECHFPISKGELDRYSKLCSFEPLTGIEAVSNAERPFSILSNMRLAPYPDPVQFQFVTTERSAWFFVNGGRLVGALLRSIYMVERSARDLEARGVLRLLYFFGFANPFITSAPSAMFMLRGLAKAGAYNPILTLTENETSKALTAAAPFGDRLWINELQWTLRRLEEEGRIQSWLQYVRSETKLRPSYLTGINWHWVEEMVALQRLKPFRSFDGAYLFVHMELETNSDPLRLRLVLDELLRGLNYRQAVDTIIEEFKLAAPAIVRRYMTTQNLLAGGLAPNYMAALDQRVRALEACIRNFGFGLLLTEEVYLSEVKTLTAELLLTNVNAGKFEVPWEIFRKDAAETHMDFYLAAESLRPRLNQEEQLTSLVDSPVSFPNGRSQTYKIRMRDTPIFSLVIALIEGFMQHPAFGLEVILSGRFRHNNLVQELWSAMGDVDAATIPAVTQSVQHDLIEEYKIATEEFIDEWCTAYMQTKRPERPQGLFDIVPDQKEAETLVNAASACTSMLEIVDCAIDWIKHKLRPQILDVRNIFGTQVREALADIFARIREEQYASNEFRDVDVQRVNTAVTDAILRRLDELSNWFDGIDATATQEISLADLSIAAETLLGNMVSDRTLKVSLDPSAEAVMFEPGEVKIAFDMLREIYFNALRYGRGPDVVLEITREPDITGTVFSFSNVPNGSFQVGEKVIEGHRYGGLNEAVTREGNSGLAKVAASSATLVGRDTTVTCMATADAYRLVVGLRPECIGTDF